MRIINDLISERFTYSVLLNGVGVTGRAVKIKIQRTSDWAFWTGTAWGSVTALDMLEVDSTNNPGLYAYVNLTYPYMVDGDVYYIRYYCADSGYEFDESEIVAVKATGVPAGVALSTGTKGTNAIYDDTHKNVNISGYALDYNFTTYSKAVMLFYNIDRPFGATDPVYWCYIYKSNGGNPASVDEIASRDQVILWSDEEPV